MLVVKIKKLQRDSSVIAAALPIGARRAGFLTGVCDP